MASSNPADVTGGNYNRRVAIYQYPADLGSPEYPHFITFTNRRSYTTTVQTAGGGRNQARRGSPGQTVALYLPPRLYSWVPVRTRCCPRCNGGGSRRLLIQASSTSRDEHQRQACMPPAAVRPSMNTAPESRVPTRRPAALAM